MSPFAELMTLGKPRGQRANAALIWTKFVALHAIRGIVPLVDVLQIMVGPEKGMTKFK